MALPREEVAGTIRREPTGIYRIVISKSGDNLVKENRGMTSAPIHSSGRDSWSNPKPFNDASTRRMKYGAIRPMEEPGWFERWFGHR